MYGSNFRVPGAVICCLLVAVIKSNYVITSCYLKHDGHVLLRYVIILPRSRPCRCCSFFVFVLYNPSSTRAIVTSKQQRKGYGTKKLVVLITGTASYKHAFVYLIRHANCHSFFRYLQAPRFSRTNFNRAITLDVYHFYYKFCRKNVLVAL